MEVFWTVMKIVKLNRQSKKGTIPAQSYRQFITLEKAQDYAQEQAVKDDTSIYTVLEVVAAYSIPDPIPPKPESLPITPRKHTPNPESEPASIYDDDYEDGEV